jgi:hypothetical protein
MERVWGGGGGVGGRSRMRGGTERVRQRVKEYEGRLRECWGGGGGG